MRKLTDIVFSLAVKCKILKQWSHTDLESGGYAPIPGGARAEAERRRAMALRALDQRLASNKTTIASNAPIPESPSSVNHHSAVQRTGPAALASTLNKNSPSAIPDGIPEEPTLDSTKEKL